MMCEEISKTIANEDHVKAAYNEFRKRNNLATIDFSDKSNDKHRIMLCIDCLLDCFQARRVEQGNYELDEVSGYRGSIWQGIGIAQHGRYPRKLGDELGIPRKRAFDNTQHGVSKGFEELAVPSNKETMMIDFNQKILEKKDKEYKTMVATMSPTYGSKGFDVDQPAGSRMPKPFKKT